MPLKDTFEYSAKWDSVGLDCSNCIYFGAPKEWPDKNREVFCIKHKIKLRIELSENGYKSGEWFCKQFEDNGTAFSPSVRHFEKIKAILQDNILYGLYGTDGYLIEYDFTVVNKWGESSGG